jgi:hypothetical protein
VTIYDLESGQSKTFGVVEAPTHYQSLVYGPAGELYVSMIYADGYRVVRFVRFDPMGNQTS